MRVLKFNAAFLAGFAAVSMFSTESSGYDGYRHPQGVLVDGPGDELPQSYNLSQLEFKQNRAAGLLCIGKDGSVKIHLENPYSLKSLDKATAIKIFGTISSFGEEKACNTFHVLASNANGPNIFHLDMDFNDEQILKKYRVRGFGITKPFWQQVN